jgi:hypothetical protein
MKKDDRLRKYAARYSALKAELQALGFVCLGSLQARRTVCGKANCRCHEDARNRHGPYHYWTRKSAGKTVGMMLTKDELPVYREWVENQRTRQRILREMHNVSTRALALTTGRKAP